MNKFSNSNDLSIEQLKQYRDSVLAAFPKIISASKTSKKYWPRLEAYFPEYQIFLLSENSEIIGFINSIPFEFDQSLNQLPDDGWDWMLKKGVSDYENNRSPNYLGGLQIIISKEYQSLGYSKQIITKAKEVFKEKALQNLLIPIRPTKKSEHPKMSMLDYMSLKDQGKVYDPWIRTHLKSGAEVIKICHNSMNIKGDIKFWENIMNEKITNSGELLPSGALNSITINIDKNIGEYREPNIWIKYD